MAVGTKTLHVIKRVQQHNIGEKPTVPLYTYHVGTPKHTVCCVCVLLFPFILDIKFVGLTSRGHTGERSHRISHRPSFCGACLNCFREKDSAIPFPRRLWSRNLCTNDFVLQPLLGIFSSKPSVPMKLCWSSGIFRLQFFVLTALLFKEKSEHI